MRLIGVAFILTLTLTLAPLAGAAQQADRSARIGYLSLNLAAGDTRNRLSFLQRLRDLGYVEGRNLQIEYRDAEGKTERFAAMAAELVALKVDVIVTSGGSLAALAAKQATTTVPIVFTAVGDPVGEGLVTSLARPGGNVTGLSVLSPELVIKSLELIKQAVPGASRVALLLKPDAMPDRARKDRLKAADVAARALGVWLQVVEARGPADFDRAFSDMTKALAGALTLVSTPVFDNERRRLVDLAAKNRLPTVYSFKAYGPGVRASRSENTRFEGKCHSLSVTRERVSWKNVGSLAHEGLASFFCPSLHTPRVLLKHQSDREALTPR